MTDIVIYTNEFDSYRTLRHTLKARGYTVAVNTKIIDSDPLGFNYDSRLLYDGDYSEEMSGASDEAIAHSIADYLDKERGDVGDIAEAAARRVSAGVRDINHTSNKIEYPAQIHRVIGSLSEAASGLPQACGQLSDSLNRLVDGGVVASDTGTLDRDTATAIANLAEAGELAQLLRERLAAAHAATGGMGYA